MCAARVSLWCQGCVWGVMGEFGDSGVRVGCQGCKGVSVGVSGVECGGVKCEYGYQGVSVA